MNEAILACNMFLRGEPVTFEIDLTQVQYNEDCSVTVGNPDSSVCFNGDFLLELLTKSENFI